MATTKKKRTRRRRKPDWNGFPPINSARMRRVVKRANKAGLVVTSTSGGSHATTSYHYLKRAADFGFSGADLNKLNADQRRRRLVAFQKAEYRRARLRGFVTYLEIIGPDNTYNVLRSRSTSLAEGTSLEQMHDNHVHVAR